MLWKTAHRKFDLSRRALVMGVLNVTPDSFSDGGRWLDADAAVEHGLELARQGADIVDVGGESTRPGAVPVGEAEELRRVLPVVARLAAAGVVVSMDTMKPVVADAAVRAGAEIVNDVTGLRDAAMRAVVRATGAGAVAMHIQGEPRTMQQAPFYADVCAEVAASFSHTFEVCTGDGIAGEQLCFDPGVGFGKNDGHNLALLRVLDGLRVAGRPLLVGVSRKSFIGRLLGLENPAERDWPTVALTSWLRGAGANVVRVHAVRPNAEALRMTEAILHEEEAA